MPRRELQLGRNMVNRVYRAEFDALSDAQILRVFEKVPSIMSSGKTQDQAVFIAISKMFPQKALRNAGLVILDLWFNSSDKVRESLGDGSGGAMRHERWPDAWRSDALEKVMSGDIVINNYMARDAQPMRGKPKVTYQKKRRGKKTYNIHNLPTFAEHTMPEFGHELKLGSKWLNASIEKGATVFDEDGYTAPLHIGHHEYSLFGGGGSQEVSGKCIPTSVRNCMYRGEPTAVQYSCLMNIKEEHMNEIDDGYLPARSVEILDITDPEVSSLALLGSETPFFRFPDLSNVLSDEDVQETEAAVRSLSRGQRAVFPRLDGKNKLIMSQGDRPYILQGLSLAVLSNFNSSVEKEKIMPNPISRDDYIEELVASSDGTLETVDNGETEETPDANRAEVSDDVVEALGGFLDGVIEGATAIKDMLSGGGEEDEETTEEPPAEMEEMAAPNADVVDRAAAKGANAGRMDAIERKMQSVVTENASLRSEIDAGKKKADFNSAVSEMITQVAPCNAGRELDQEIVRMAKDQGVEAARGFVRGYVANNTGTIPPKTLDDISRDASPFDSEVVSGYAKESPEIQELARKASALWRANPNSSFTEKDFVEKYVARKR